MKKLAENSTFKNLGTWNPVGSQYGKQERKKWEQWQILFSWAPKSLWTVTEAMKLADTCSLEGKLRLCVVVAQLCSTLRDPWTVAHRLLCPWNSSGKNPGVGCHLLLYGIFLTQGSNLNLLHCRQILYCWASMEGHTYDGASSNIYVFLINAPYWY